MPSRDEVRAMVEAALERAQAGRGQDSGAAHDVAEAVEPGEGMRELFDTVGEAIAEGFGDVNARERRRKTGQFLSTAQPVSLRNFGSMFNFLSVLNTISAGNVISVGAGVSAGNLISIGAGIAMGCAISIGSGYAMGCAVSLASRGGTGNAVEDEWPSGG